MGIFSGLFKSRDKPQNRTSGSNYAFFMGGTTSGKAVTERSAMQMTAVYSCVRILSEAVELFVIENHRAMSYAKIGEPLGITGNRVAQIKTMALRKIREEKRREEAWKRGQQKVDYALTRSQCYLWC